MRYIQKEGRIDERPAIGIMGGTFDPIHYGHLVAAECSAEQFDLEMVIFVPAGSPPHKEEQRVTSSTDRYMMTLLATISNPLFVISKVEIEREGLSYTIDTLLYFREKYPEHDIYFITGADAIAEIFTWKDPERLLEECSFIAVTRPGFPIREECRKIIESYSKRIFPLSIPGVATSSTHLRSRARRGLTLKYQVPPEVDAFIKKRSLY